MSLRHQIEEIFQRQVTEFSGCEEFANLEAGRASEEEVDQLLAGIVRAHLRSPKLLAFIYALAPPAKATDALRHNMLEDLGVEDEIEMWTLGAKRSGANGNAGDTVRAGTQALQL